MPGTLSTYAAFKIDPSFNFDNFSQESHIRTESSLILANKRPDSLRPTVSENGSIYFRLSDQSRPSSFASSGGPVTPRLETLLPEFSHALTIASLESEPQSQAEDESKRKKMEVVQDAKTMRSQTQHSRFARMSYYGIRPNPIETMQQRPAYEERQSSLPRKGQSLTPIDTQLSRVSSPQLIESPLSYNGSPYEDGLIAEITTVKITKPTEIRSARNTVYLAGTRPKTLVISSTPDMGQPIPDSATLPKSDLSLHISKPVAAPASMRKPCPVHGSRPKTTLLTATQPTTLIPGQSLPLPGPAIPSKLRDSQIVNTDTKSAPLRASMTYDLVFKHAVSKQKEATSLKKEILPPENRKSSHRPRFSFEAGFEEPKNPVLQSKTSDASVTSQKPMPMAAQPTIEPVAQQIGSIVVSTNSRPSPPHQQTKSVIDCSTNSKPEKSSKAPAPLPSTAEETVELIMGSPIKLPPLSIPEMNGDKRYSSRRSSTASTNSILTITTDNGTTKSTKPRPPCPVHGTNHRPSGNWSTRPPELAIPSSLKDKKSSPLSPSTSSASAPSSPILKKITNGVEPVQQGTMRASSTSPSSVSKSLGFLQNDPFRSNTDPVKLTQRPKSAGHGSAKGEGGSNYFDFDKAYGSGTDTKKQGAPSVMSSKSTRSVKSGLSKVRRILTRKKRLTTDVQ